MNPSDGNARTQDGELKLHKEARNMRKLITWVTIRDNSIVWLDFWFVTDSPPWLKMQKQKLSIHGHGYKTNKYVICDDSAIREVGQNCVSAENKQ